MRRKCGKDVQRGKRGERAPDDGDFQDRLGPAAQIGGVPECDPLANEINRGRADNVKSIQGAKTVTTARVLDATVTTVDSHFGQAAYH